MWAYTSSTGQELLDNTLHLLVGGNGTAPAGTNWAKIDYDNLSERNYLVITANCYDEDRSEDMFGCAVEPD